MQENYGIFNSTRPPDFLQRKRDSTTLTIYFNGDDKLLNKHQTYRHPVPSIITVIASALNSTTNIPTSPLAPAQSPSRSSLSQTNSSTKQRPKSFFQRFNGVESTNNESLIRTTRYRTPPVESADFTLPSAITFNNDDVFGLSPSAGDEPKLRRRFTFRRSLRQKPGTPSSKEQEQGKLRSSFTKAALV
ncbi:unnamed protein product, partial [Didymodactylos carnosus]